MEDVFTYMLTCVGGINIWSSLLYLTSSINRRLSDESTCKAIVIYKLGEMELDHFKSWKSLLLYIVHKYSQLHLRCKLHRINKQYNVISGDPQARVKRIVDNYKVKEGDIISWDEGFIFSKMQYEILIDNNLVSPIRATTLPGNKFPLCYWSNILPDLNMWISAHNVKLLSNFTIPKQMQVKYSKPLNTLYLYTGIVDYVEYTLISYSKIDTFVDIPVRFVMCRILTSSDKSTILLLKDFGIDYNFNTYLMVESQCI